MAASTWLAAMSANRSFFFHAPGRISSSVVTAKPTSSKPTAADSMRKGDTTSS